MLHIREEAGAVLVEATVGVRIRAEGATELKSRLQELRTEFRRGDISVSEYSKGLREVNRDARALTQQSQIQTNIWRAQYPVLNNLTRSMSAIGSISRTALTAVTAFATIRTAFNTANSNLLELRGQLAEAERNAKRFAAAGDAINAKEWEEKAAIIREQIKETNDQLAQDKISNIIAIGATFGTIGSNIGTIISKKDDFKGMFSAIKSAIGSTSDDKSPMGALSTFNAGLGTSNTRLGNLKTALNIGAAAGAFGIAIAGATGKLDDFYESLTGQKLNKSQSSLLNDVGLLGGATAGGAIVGNMVGGPPDAVAGGVIGALSALIKLLGDMTTVRPAGGPVVIGGGGTSRGAGAGDTPSIAVPTSSTSSGLVNYKGLMLTPEQAARAKAAGFASGGVIKEPALLIGLKTGGMGIMAERGPEAIRPMKTQNTGEGNTLIINNYISGTVWEFNNLMDKIDDDLKKRLRRMGFVA
jgi:hypothetical protein